MFVLPPWSSLDDGYSRCKPSLPSGNGGGYYSQYLAVVTQNAPGSDFLNATTNNEIKTALRRYDGRGVGLTSPFSFVLIHGPNKGEVKKENTTTNPQKPQAL